MADCCSAFIVLWEYFPSPLEPLSGGLQVGFQRSDYLALLNAVAGRSYHDVTQYSSALFERNSSNAFSLNWPMFHR